MPHIDDITDEHPVYTDNKVQWEYLRRSFNGGNEYKEGCYLFEYEKEDPVSYKKRLDNTPLENHCKGTIQVSQSFLWRVGPVRDLDSLKEDPVAQDFLNDADFDGSSLNAFMHNASTWASVYGHVWIVVDRPSVDAKNGAEEIAVGVRPYSMMFTPERVTNWRYEKTGSGMMELALLVIIEDETAEAKFFRVWTPETISLWRVETGEAKGGVENIPTLEGPEIPNPLGYIPADPLYAQKSDTRGKGVSDIGDIADQQRSIYNCNSEVEQAIRIEVHPSLVVTQDVANNSTSGAGSMVIIPEDIDPHLVPRLLQVSGSTVDGILANIKRTGETIDKMAHMGSVRGTATTEQSGIARKMEFQLLSASLSKKADQLELTEEHMWQFFADWQGQKWNGVIDYPDSFDLTDADAELDLLMKASAAGVESDTLSREIDKKIAELIVEGEVLDSVNVEIDAAPIDELDALTEDLADADQS